MVDWTRPIQTRDGQAARLLGVLNDKRRTHIVAIDSGDGDGEYTSECNDHGRVVGVGVDCTDDVINVPVTRTVYLNVYDAGTDCVPICSVHDSKELADSITGGCLVKVACVELTYTEGEGLA